MTRQGVGESLWPGAFRWLVLCVVGFATIFGGVVGHGWWWVPTAAGFISLGMGAVQLWPSDNPRARRVAHAATPRRRGLGSPRGRRCRAKDPDACRHARCPDRES